MSAGAGGEEGQQLVLGAAGAARAAHRVHGGLAGGTALAAARGEDGERDGVDGVAQQDGEALRGRMVQCLGAEVAVAGGAFEDRGDLAA